MKVFSLLVIEDDSDMAELLAEIAKQVGFQTRVCLSVSEGLVECERFLPDVLLTDLRLPDGSGLDVLRRVKKWSDDVLVMMITGYATLEDAIEGFKEGLFDLITKPFETQQVANRLEKALMIKRQQLQLERLEKRLNQVDSADTTVVSESRAMQGVLEQLAQAAPLDVPILINGETGVGKGVLAKTIHQASGRCDGPYFELNCAAVPENLIDSELFGFEKGAFTGAGQRKLGLLELANGGTLLLDEINSTQLDVQAKLLHFLQNQTLVRVGGQQSIQVDVRLLFASNQPLKAMVDAGRFREDLYYRIHVFPVDIAPLRQRQEDVVPLAHAFIRKYSSKFGKPVYHLSSRCAQALQRYAWPGNIRELENIIQRAVVLAKGSEIEVNHLPRELFDVTLPEITDASGQTVLPENATLAEVEAFWIERALEACQGNKTMAAKKLGIDPSTLYRKLQPQKQ